MLIFTSKGMLPAASLTYTTGSVENENEFTTWEEWRDETDEIVKRNAHVRLKRGQEITLEQGKIG